MEWSSQDVPMLRHLEFYLLLKEALFCCNETTNLLCASFSQSNLNHLLHLSVPPNHHPQLSPWLV